MTVTFLGNKVMYRPKVSEDNLWQIAESSMTHRVYDYTSLERSLDNLLFQIDPYTEIYPTADQLRLEGVEEWEGNSTIHSRLDLDTIKCAVRTVLGHGGLLRNPMSESRGHSYELEFVPTKCKAGYRELTFVLFPPSQGGGNFSSSAALPVDLGPEASSEPLSLAVAHEAAPLAFNLAVPESGQIECLQRATANYLQSVGLYTQEAGEYLNQADWHTILRSLGPIAAATGFAAWGLGGFIGGVLEGLAAFTGTASAAVKTSDFASSDQAQEILQVLELIVTTQRQPVEMATFAEESIEITEDGEWVVVEKKASDNDDV